MLYDAPRRLSLLAEVLHLPASLGLHGVDYSCKSEPEHNKVVQRKQKYKIPFFHVISSELLKRTQEKTYTYIQQCCGKHIQKIHDYDRIYDECERIILEYAETYQCKVPYHTRECKCMIEHNQSHNEVREKSTHSVHPVLHEHMDNLYLAPLPSLSLYVQSVHILYRIDIEYRFTAQCNLISEHIPYLKCYMCVLTHSIRIVHISLHDG